MTQTESYPRRYNQGLINAMSISSLEKEDGPLCKYLISYPINPEDPGRDSGSPDHSL